MSFTADMDRIVRKARAAEVQLFNNCLAHAQRSILVGSPVTSAPGQPVDTGRLITSWSERRYGRQSAELVSSAPYAEVIENNKRGANLRSKVGGFHSIKLTRLGWGRIVSYEGRKIGVKSPGIRSGSKFEL